MTSATAPARPGTPGKHPWLAALLLRPGRSRFLTVSVLLHFVLVLMLGTLVLFRDSPEVTDFIGDGTQFLTDAGGEAGTAAPEQVPEMPEVSQVTEAIQSPDAILQALVSLALQRRVPVRSD